MPKITHPNLSKLYTHPNIATDANTQEVRDFSKKTLGHEVQSSAPQDARDFAKKTLGQEIPRNEVQEK
jgi:hypothetical protein